MKSFGPRGLVQLEQSTGPPTIVQSPLQTVRIPHNTCFGQQLSLVTDLTLYRTTMDHYLISGYVFTGSLYKGWQSRSMDMVPCNTV